MKRKFGWDYVLNSLTNYLQNTAEKAFQYQQQLRIKEEDTRREYQRKISVGYNNYVVHKLLANSEP